jgi:cytochrome c
MIRNFTKGGYETSGADRAWPRHGRQAMGKGRATWLLQELMEKHELLRRRRLFSPPRAAAPVLLYLLMGPATNAVAAAPSDAPAPLPASVAIHISGNRSFYWNDRKLRYLIVTDDPGVGDSLHGTLPVGQTAVHFGRLMRAESLPASFLAAGGLTANVARARAVIGRENCLVCHTVEDSNASVVPSFTTIARSAVDDAGTRSRWATIIVKGSDTAVGGIKMPPHPSLGEADVGSVVDFILTLHAADANPRLVPLSGELRLDDGRPLAPAGQKPTGHENRSYVYVLAAAYRRNGDAADAAPTASAVLRLRSPLFAADEASGSGGTKAAAVANLGSVRIAEDAGAYLYFDDVDLTAVSAIEVTLARPSKGAVPNDGRIVLRVDGTDGRTLGSAEIAAAPGEGSRERLAIPIEHIEGFHRLYVMLEPDSSAHRSHASFASVEILPGVSDDE